MLQLQENLHDVFVSGQAVRESFVASIPGLRSHCTAVGASKQLCLFHHLQLIESVHFRVLDLFGSSAEIACSTKLTLWQTTALMASVKQHAMCI